MASNDTWHGRLYCQFFWVEARLSRQNGRWIASVDTPEGPTLARGRTPLSALVEALQPFEGVSLQLIESAPPDLRRILQS